MQQETAVNRYHPLSPLNKIQVGDAASGLPPLAGHFMNVLQLKLQILKEAGLNDTDLMLLSNKHYAFWNKLHDIGARKMAQYKATGIFPPDIDADVELTDQESNELMAEFRSLFENEGIQGPQTVPFV